MNHETMWHSESVEPLRWPGYTLAKWAADVVLLDVEKADGVEAVVIGFVDTRDGSRNRVWIGLAESHILRHVSVAPGRTVRLPGLEFNRRIAIVAPDGT